MCLRRSINLTQLGIQCAAGALNNKFTCFFSVEYTKITNQITPKLLSEMHGNYNKFFQKNGTFQQYNTQIFMINRNSINPFSKFKYKEILILIWVWTMSIIFLPQCWYQGSGLLLIVHTTAVSFFILLYLQYKVMKSCSILFFPFPYN